MSERIQRMFVESVSSPTVELSPDSNARENQAGIGIASVTVTTVEATAQPAFWGTTGSCAVFDVIIRKVQ